MKAKPPVGNGLTGGQHHVQTIDRGDRMLPKTRGGTIMRRVLKAVARRLDSTQTKHRR